MTHTLELPEEIYQALTEEAARRGQSPQALIQAWVATLHAETTTPAAKDEQRVNNPQFDPWAGFRNATTALSPDSLDRHDEYLANEAVNSHESE